MEFLIAIFCLTVSSTSAAPAHTSAAPVRLDHPMELFWTSTGSNASYRVLAQGGGPAVRLSETVTFHVIVRRTDGTAVHSTHDGQPRTLQLTPRGTREGAEGGLLGMKLGEVRRLLVPPFLDGRVLDPAVTQDGQVLLYDIEMISAAPGPLGPDSGC